MFGDSRPTFRLDRAFPHNGRAPASYMEGTEGSPIPLDISFEFRCPEFRSCRWRGRETATLVPVPETTVNENHGPVSRENQIGLSWQGLGMKPISEPESMKGVTEHNLRLGVPALDPGHHSRSGRGVDDVDHH